MGVDRGVVAAAQTVGFVNAAGRAEINAAGQFTDDHQVEAFDTVSLQAGGVDERGKAESGAQVCKYVEALAQSEEARFRALVPGGARPFRAADGAEQDGVRFAGTGEGLVRKRDAMRIKARAADEAGLDDDIGHEEFGDPARLGDDFRTDAVTRQEEECLFHGVRSPRTGLTG